jgi:Ca-activated chloride channel family protein
MKKRGKILLATLLAASMAMTMAACGSTQKAEAPTTPAVALYSTADTAKDSVNRTPPTSMIVNSEMDVQMSEAMALEMDQGMAPEMQQKAFNTEEYNAIEENRPMKVSMSPLSTFSIDVDTASYSNIRRFLEDGIRPPADAVRIEEMINYFTYDLPQPDGEVPFSITTELGKCPWNGENYLAMIALQGKGVSNEDLPKSNLVFLFDVSGSMDSPDKLPLLKSSFQLLVEQLGENDRVSIVVYAGASGVVLDSARGDEKEKISEALNGLEAGGSTAGGEGIELAYKIAKKNYISGGTIE